MVKIVDKKYKLQEIARRIEEARTSRTGEPVAFDGMAIHDIYSVLESSLEFHPEVPDADKHDLVRKGVGLAAKDSEVKEEALLKQWNKLERDYLSVRPKDFVLATSVSIVYFDELKRARVNNSSISFSRHLPNNYKRDELHERIKEVANMENFGRFTHVRVRVKARTNAAAVNEALYNLDYLRGIWNYLVNRRTRVQFLYGSHPQPINRIVLGPIHTLHFLNGKLATEEFWYQSRDLQYDKLYKLALIWKDFSNQVRKIRGLVADLPYSRQIIGWFIRYVRALDSSDPDIAFNKLWAVLEQLSNSPGKYEQLVRRVLFLVDNDERDYVSLVLEHLRDVRNGLVHDDRSRIDLRVYIYQLKWFIEQAFSFHLRVGGTFKSLAEASEFLDLPYNTDILREKAALYQKALRFKKA